MCESMFECEARCVVCESQRELAVNGPDEYWVCGTCKTYQFWAWDGSGRAGPWLPRTQIIELATYYRPMPDSPPPISLGE